jgi:tripeptide aminopeptidase
MQTAVSPSTHIIEELLANPAVKQAFQLFEEKADQITDEQIRICSIPAPPFAETERAEYLRERFVQLGLQDPIIDEEGNCIALRPGRNSQPLLAISAHLDTVFPAGTDCEVRRSGTKLLAPGISDDCCGLVALFALAEALKQCGIETEGSLLFVGTVGEEGEGNLRGVTHLFKKGAWANKIDAFVSLDGAGIDRITNGALGSKRYRVRIKGAGGHSWADFGISNPVHALGRAIAKLSTYPAPEEPRTTFNVGRVEGGVSVNSIPTEASMDVDLRSASETELVRLDAFFRRSVREATEEENSLRRKGKQPLQLEVKLIGDRPSGETPASEKLVELAMAATKAVGVNAQLDRASTDSNIPISLGIPAVTLGAGGTSANSHTLAEWYDPRERDIGLKRALLLLLGTVGVSKDAVVF